ncbi:dTMP kinase [Alphaproteobacteria bacterium]|nr:dTMP kinase [Alphaproteobacteria bacterium]
MTRGRFITIEGGEGTGKSTQIPLLAHFLRAANIEVVQTREPGGSPAAEKIRELLVNGPTDRWDPVTETMLHFAARREHLKRTIVPALNRGAWVVCDRFADSTMAYQGYGLGVARDLIEDLYRMAVGDMKPDLTIILDIPPEIGLKRADDRLYGGTRYERMDVAFHKRLRAGFIDISRRESKRCFVVDATGSIDAIAERIQQKIKTWLTTAQS